MQSKTYNISFNTNYLEHIGNKNSGRYPRGSGKNPRAGRGIGKESGSVFSKIKQAKNYLHNKKINSKKFKYSSNPYDINQLSDAELDAQIRRLEKENRLKQYIDNLNPPKKIKKPGIISRSGKNALEAVLPLVGIYGLSRALGGDKQNLGGIVYRKLLKGK